MRHVNYYAEPKPASTVFKGENNAEFTLLLYKKFADFLIFDDDPEKNSVVCYPALLIGSRPGEPARYEFTVISYCKENIVRFHRPSCGLDYSYSEPIDPLLMHYCLRLINGDHCGIIHPADSWEVEQWADAGDKISVINCIESVVIAAGRMLYPTFQELDWHMRCTDSLFSIFTRTVDSESNKNCPLLIKKTDLRLMLEKIIAAKHRKSKRPSLSVKLRRSIMERDGYRCLDCGRNPRVDPSCILHVDHRIAVANGGSNDPSNLQTLCDWCNLGKKTDTDWKLAKKR
jgi:hypothetical protein